MNSLAILTYEELLKTYYLAVNKGLEEDFIEILRNELDRRAVRCQADQNTKHPQLTGV
ncbi:sporulation histidine kinase inhibitor Sda [Bacillus tuaregi]|uniref:sporulation histidine kinase inhibitor Sda n=1 Tax=Bacillus tuaregi TaxID=1816695 RepID=UPI000A0727B5|nr:sporulation histidine kinase inhibitor Sda [Bacillus tuaregi]